MTLMLGEAAIVTSAMNRGGDHVRAEHFPGPDHNE